MTKPTGPTNPVMRKLARKLRARGRKLGVSLWRDVAERLVRPRRSRAEVNISHINRHTDDGDTVVVPGKVLGSGKLDHSITVAAFRFSGRAWRKIRASGGRAMEIGDLVDENPQGSNIILME